MSGELIKFIRETTADGFKLVMDKASENTLHALFKKKRTEGWFKFVTPKEARSLQQNKYYWSHVLPLMCENVGKLDQYLELRNDKPRFDAAHRKLSLGFAIKTNRTHLIDWMPTYDNHDKKWIEVPYVSFSFEKMPSEDATEYLAWLESAFFSATGSKFDEMTPTYKAA